VKTLGYDNIHTLLLTAPPYVLAVFTTFLNAWHADKTGERFWHIVLPLCVGVAAFILAACTHSTAPRYVAMMLMVPGVYTGYVVALAWISNSMPRPPAKRAAALAFINAVSNTSSIYASYMYPQPKSGAQPNLTVPLAVDCATAGLAIIMTVVMRIVLGRLNKKLDRGEHVEGAINAIPGKAQERGFRFLV
jgi:MFS family permease